MQPLVSILIPAYNSEEWVSDAIESAMAQTWLNKEIIVVDDGSSDNTLTVARRYQSKDVKVTTQPNQGASVARNTALGLCQGNFIQYLDADDLLAPDKIEKQLSEVDLGADQPPLLSSAWGYFYYRPRKAEFRPNSLWQDLSAKEWLLRKTETNEWMALQAWLVSRELTERAGPWDVNLPRNNDGEYFCRVLCQSDRVVFVPEARSYVRRSNLGSITSRDICLSRAQLDSLFLSFTKHIDCLRSLVDDERSRAACVSMLQGILSWFLLNERRDLVEKAQRIAVELGGRLDLPPADSKYAAMERVLGRRLTTRARSAVHRGKASLVIRWDKLLATWEGKDSRRAPFSSLKQFGGVRL